MVKEVVPVNSYMNSGVRGHGQLIRMLTRQPGSLGRRLAPCQQSYTFSRQLDSRPTPLYAAMLLAGGIGDETSCQNCF